MNRSRGTLPGVAVRESCPKSKGSLQRLEHDERIHITKIWVCKGKGESADDFEAEALPESHGPVVGAHDEVELHGPKPPGSGEFERMRAHRASNPSPRRFWGGHVSAVGDMGTAAELVRPQVVSAE